MKLFGILFGKRRWILWLPYIATLIQTIAEPKLFLPAVFAATILGSPLLLAWWLSDGFTDLPPCTARESSSVSGPGLYYDHVTGHTQSYPGAGCSLIYADEGGHLTNNPRA